MNILKKIKLFTINLWNSWPVEEILDEAYLTVIAGEGFNLEIEFNFNVDNAAMVANILYQLDSGLLTGTIVEAINQRCMLDNRHDELEVFMAALNLISETRIQLNDVQVNEPVIKPSHVFKYTQEQPKFN